MEACWLLPEKAEILYAVLIFIQQSVPGPKSNLNGDPPNRMLVQRQKDCCMSDDQCFSQNEISCD